MDEVTNEGVETSQITNEIPQMDTVNNEGIQNFTMTEDNTQTYEATKERTDVAKLTNKRTQTDKLTNNKDIQLEGLEECRLIDSEFIEALRRRSNNNTMSDEIIQKFKNFSSFDQLSILETLLKVSHSDVKYEFQQKVEDITRFDILSNVPQEILEMILKEVSLNTLLRCRQVCKSWKRVINRSTMLWQPHLERYCIDAHGFSKSRSDERKLSMKEGKESSVSVDNLSVIGERLFNLTVARSENELQKNDDSYDTSMAKAFVMGRHILLNFYEQADFRVIIDHDCRGSNVVMTMNDGILAYAREDRHIVVKYADFPHKKINLFEAHQCADIKFYDKYIITGGYDRMIRIWNWVNGDLVASLEGSMKPVYSLDVIDDVLYSSDGKHVISWDLARHCMMNKTECYDEDYVEEISSVDVCACPLLNGVYDTPLLITRSKCEMKVWKCLASGYIELLSLLEQHSRRSSALHPFIRVFKDKLACSSEDGILVWSLVDFNLVNFIERSECVTCDMRYNTIFPRSGNCRVILLQYTNSLVLQYHVHANSFQLFSLMPDSKVKISWEMPSNEIWPWSHRKPGMASMLTDIENGITADTKLSLFVATQGKKIYGMLFDANDFENEISFS